MCEGIAKSCKLLIGVLLALLISSVAMADQITLTYLGDDAELHDLVIDAASSIDDLTTAATLFAANGASVSYNPDAGMGSLPDIAQALTEVLPFFAADIAQAITLAVPEQKIEVVAAVNSVSGVNTTAVLAAVHFGPTGIVVPPYDQGAGLGSGSLVIEQVIDNGFGAGGVVSPN